MSRRINGPVLSLLIGLGLATAISGAAGQTRPTRGVGDRAELEAFLDGVLTSELRDKHVAGAVVSVVKDGQILLSKGYGFADFDTRKPVDPDRTMFRPGSVSKLFTWTAVMQLVEQGKLDLDRDVNGYLDFAIPATFPQPITLRHLLTHTLGTEDDARDLISDDSTRIRPMGQWLPAHMPRRVRPPGVFSSYSNWGTAVAGYIVERVSGEPFPDYVQRHILDPLGMTHSTPRQPLPTQLSPDMSRGYEWSGGRFVAHSFEFLPGAAPAGMMSASGSDMARFMIAHLQNGEFQGARILADSTALRMHARAFGHHDQLPGFALGFYEKSSHGIRIIGHGGDSQWFHTDLALIPEEKVGVYVSYNTNTGGALSAGPFLETFLDHYYPEPIPPAPAAPADFARQAQKFAGLYRSNRHNYSTYLKALELGGGTRISVGDSGTLMLSGDGPARLVPVGPLLFRNAVGTELVAFREDSAGRITHLVTAEPMLAYERQPWPDSTRLHLVIFVLAIVVFVGALVAAIARIVRRHPKQPPPQLIALGRRVLALVALLQLGFFIALAVLASNPIGIVFGGSEPKVRAVLILEIVAAVVTLGALVVATLQWIRRAGTTRQRLQYSSAVLVALLLLWSFRHWNLLGWKL